MAKKKISKFADAILPLAGNEIVTLIQGGVNRNAPVNALPGGDGGITTGKYMIGGGAAWSGTGFVWDVTTLIYFFNGQKTAAATSLTLDASDPDNNRFDAIVVDEAGNVTVITGTPASSPITPIIPEEQLLVQYILVEAGTTEPTITQDNIYLDNAEWASHNYTTGGTQVGTSNFDATNSPKQGTKCIDNSLDPRTGIRFTRASAIDLSGYSSLSLWVRFPVALGTAQKVIARFENTSLAPTGTQVNLMTYGLNRNITGTWQLALIPLTLFGGLTNVQGLRIILNGGTNGTQVLWDVDFITLSDGSVPVINSPTINFYKDSSLIAAQKGLNIIAGSGMTITASEDTANERVNYTLESTGGGGDVTKAYVDAADATLQGNIDAEATARSTADDGKVDKVTGKGLSTEDYTTAEKTKLAGIAAGAQVNDANTTLQGNTFNGNSQLVKTDGSGKLPAIDGSQLTNLPAAGLPAATSAEINIGTDNTKAATPYNLTGSKYITQDGAKLYVVASGTNTYTGALSPAITALVTGMRVNVQFTNGNTGASTFNLNSTGAKNIYKGGTNSLVSGDISAGQIIGVVYDGTYWQLQGSTQAFPSTPNKVITTDGSGVLQAANDLIDINSTTTEATLIAATWTGGVATATGTPGTWVLGTTSNYLYICTGTNTWIRIPAYLDYLDVYLGSVSDSGGTKTSTQMAALYPSAVRGQYAVGTAGMYMYMGMVGWYYFANTI